MLILIALAVILVLGTAVMVLVWRLNKANGATVAANLKTQRTTARLQRADRQVKALEERCALLETQLNASVAQRTEVLHVAKHVEIVADRVDEVGDQVGTLLMYVGQPVGPALDGGPGQHRQALPQEHPVQQYPRELDSHPYDGHNHVEHSQNGSMPDGVTISAIGGTIRYMSHGE
jgi:hypothetical protein